MFNERFGLQQATFDGTKTMTRRAVPDETMKDALAYQSHHIDDEKAYEKYILDHAPYKVGEIVAVAQRYSQLVANGYLTEDGNLSLMHSEGWGNKMYVKAELMQRHIKMTGIKVEGLAGISDEDCLREGIKAEQMLDGRWEFYFTDKRGACNRPTQHMFRTPYAAFKALIDKLNRRGFFETNPLVFAYSYEIID